MGFSHTVQDEALVASGRCCCICHKFCGTKINLHHIVQIADGGDDSFENCIPLCLDCHEDMGKADPRHSTGKHYSSSELRIHRDNWFACVKNGLVNSHLPVCEEDKELFNKICSIITPDIQNVIKNYDFRGSIPGYFAPALNDLCHLEENLENEFIDTELEKLRGSLFGVARSFRHYLARDTFYQLIGKQEYLVPRLWLLKEGEIKPEKEDFGDFGFEDDGLEYEKPEDDVFSLYRNRYEAEADRLNVYAEQFWIEYKDFYRRGRRIVKR